MMRGVSLNECSTLQSFGLKLALLGGVMGLLYIADVGPGAFRAPGASHTSSAQNAPHAAPSTGHVNASMRVDLNQGSLAALQTLPGIGEVMSERIVRYRREHGDFAAPEDIQEVKGIGAGTFAKLRPYLRVAGYDDSSTREERVVQTERKAGATGTGTR